MAAHLLRTPSVRRADGHRRRHARAPVPPAPRAAAPTTVPPAEPRSVDRDGAAAWGPQADYGGVAAGRQLLVSFAPNQPGPGPAPPAARAHPPARQARGRTRSSSTTPDDKSVTDWIDAARRESHGGGTANAERIVDCLKDLSYLSPAAVRRRGSDVEAAVAPLAGALRFVPGGADAVAIDWLGTAVIRHEGLVRAVERDTWLREVAVELLGAAVARDDVYENEQMASRIATAQTKLRVHCAVFWQRLEGVDLTRWGGRAIAPLLHRSVMLVVNDRMPPHSAALWATMLRGLRAALARGDFGRDDTAMRRAVSETLAGLGTAVSGGQAAAVAAQDTEEQRELVVALRRAAARAAHAYNAPTVTSVWRAVATLGAPPPGEELEQLLAAAERVSPYLSRDSAPKLLSALVVAGAPVPKAVLDATQRVIGTAGAKGVCKVWWALANKPQRLSMDLSEALCSAAARTAAQLEAREVVDVAWAMARLHVGAHKRVRGPLAEAARRAFRDITERRALADETPESRAWRVARLVWAGAMLHLPIYGPAHDAACAALHATLERMEPHNVGFAVRGIAGLRLMLPPATRELMHAAILRSVEHWQGYESTIVLWALGKLGHDDVPELVRAALLAGVEGTAAAAGVPQVLQTLQGLAALQWDVPGSFREAWLRALARTAPDLTATSITSAVEALEELQWRLSDDVVAALAATHEEGTTQPAEEAARTQNSLRKLQGASE